MLNLDELKQILELVRQHDLSELEIEQEGTRIKIRKDASGGVVTAVHPPMAAAVHAPSAAAVGGGASAGMAAPVVADAADAEIELAVVKSPIVGTFYRSPEPGAPSFVEIGTSVKKGQVLCIIEAMKLMNEIESDCDGEITAIYAENGKPVQFGDRLFAVKVK